LIAQPEEKRRELVLERDRLAEQIARLEAALSDEARDLLGVEG
jgi:hypothetical protein